MFNNLLLYIVVIISFTYTGRSFKPGPGEILKECIPELERQCRSRLLRSMKVIRMAGMLAEKLLQVDPTIKIVYYTRDPRGMMVSRAGLGGHYEGLAKIDRVNRSSMDICRRVRHDMKKYDELHEKNYQVLRMRYEDLALGPEKTVDKLYQFLGEAVPQEVLTWIHENTKAEQSNGALGTKRNSTAVASRWRGILSEEAVKVASRNCADVLTYQGYPLT